MKKVCFILLAAVSLFAASCVKEARTDIVPIPGLLNISFSTENTLTPLAGGDICWKKSDTIMVFDEADTGVKFYTFDDNVPSATFLTFNWSDMEPAFASMSSIPLSNATCTHGVMTVRLSENQPVTDRDFPSAAAAASVGRVTAAEGRYNVNGMKNVSGLIRIAFENPDAAAIRIESGAGEPVAGVVEVDYARLERGDTHFWTEVDGQGKSSILLTPAGSAATGEGCFKPDSFYVAILPQTYSKGLKISMLDKAGGTILTKSEGYDDGLTIDRNDINIFESGLDDTLPAVIEVVLNFYNETNTNPLGTFIAVENQRLEGEDYTYIHHYVQGGEEKTMNLVFGLSKGSATGANGYLYAPHHASFFGTTDGLNILNINNGAINGSAGTSPFWIRLPGIKGRSLNSVVLHIGNGAAKNMQIREEPEGEAVFEASSTAGSASALGAATFNNKGAGMRLKPGEPYYVVFTSKNGYQFYDLELTYTR